MSSLMEDLPKRVLIVGGGYIACEFACILKGLGAEVTQYYRGAQILRGFDDEARGHIAELMREQGIDLHVGTDVERMEKRKGGIWVKATDGREAEFDAVIYATGRKPNTVGLGLEDTGVKLGRQGQIEVDDYSQTAVPSIFAVGDVTDRINLTPVAIREGAAFVETVFNGNPTKPDHDLVPSAVFTQPEYGSVGLTEEAARDQEPIEVYCAAFRPMQNAFIGKNERVLFKLIVSAESRKILGCHIIAPNAGETDPDGRRGDKDGRDQGRFRPDGCGSPHNVGRDRTDEIASAKSLISGRRYTGKALTWRMTRRERGTTRDGQ